MRKGTCRFGGAPAPVFVDQFDRESRPASRFAATRSGKFVHLFFDHGGIAMNSLTRRSLIVCGAATAAGAFVIPAEAATGTISI
jgi:hypothetical protein